MKISNQAQKDRILIHLRRVGEVKKACELAGVPQRTAYDWRTKDPVFDRQIRHTIGLWFLEPENEARRDDTEAG